MRQNGKHRVASFNYCLLPDGLNRLESLDRHTVTKRDLFGRTLLHNACICGDSQSVRQLLANPFVDVTALEYESGSSALHLALASGSLHCAQLLIRHSRELLRVKDRDGCPAFESALYYHYKWSQGTVPSEYFSFGSNANHTLGFPDSDDRQTPETVKVVRPLAKTSIRKTLAPVRVVDCAIGAYHTAILTSDESANLYVCGVSSRGRLGLGENVPTQFTPALVADLASEKIVSVGVGRDHTACVTNRGVVYTWGCNQNSQLGYNTSEELQTSPRRVGGPTLKKAPTITHVTCSNVHTVCWRQNSSDMYVWGKNNGQLGGVPSGKDLDIPTMVALVPGKITAACASDHYTACIIDDSYIQVYMNGGHFRLFLPNPGSASKFDVFKPRLLVNSPKQLFASANGPMICVSSLGHVYDLPLNQYLNMKPTLVARQMPITALWVPRRDKMIATNAAVGDDGSVIICTVSGSAWKREHKKTRFGVGNSSLTEYKFSRIPKVTNAYKVACDPLFRSFAALRYSTQVDPITVDFDTLEFDVSERNHDELKMTFFGLDDEKESQEVEDMPNSSALNWLVDSLQIEVALTEESLMKQLTPFEQAITGYSRSLVDADPSRGYDCELYCDQSTVKLPCHSYMLRSIELKQLVETKVPLHCSLLTLVILHHYLYNDSVLSLWALFGSSRSVPREYIEAKNELLTLGKDLSLSSLVCKLSFGETANQLAVDMADILYTGDIELLVDGTSLKAHKFILIQQSEFFKTIFSTRWNGDTKTKVDLQHLPSKSVKICLRFMYTSNFDSLFENESNSNSKDFISLVSDVLATSDELLLTPLKQFCELILSEMVTVKNVTQLMFWAFSYNCTKLQRFLLSYVCVNMECLLEGGFLSQLDDELFEAVDHHYRLMVSSEKPADWVESFLNDFDGHNERLCRVSPGKRLDPTISQTEETRPAEEIRPSVSPTISPDLKPEGVFDFELDECPAEQRKRRDDVKRNRSEWKEVRTSKPVPSPFSKSPFSNSPLAKSPLGSSPQSATTTVRRTSFASAASGTPFSAETKFSLSQSVEKDSAWPTLGGSASGASASGVSGSPASRSWGKVTVDSVNKTPSTPGSALSDLFLSPSPSTKLSQKERRRLQKQQQEEMQMRAQEKEKREADGPWKLKKKPQIISPFQVESSPSVTRSGSSSATPTRTPSRASAAPETSQPASDFYSQPVLSLAEIRERQERSAQKAKNVKTIEEIQQEEMFQKWWDAEVARTKQEEERRATQEATSSKRRHRKGNNKGGGKGKPGDNGDGSGGSGSGGKNQRPRQIRA